MGLVPRQKRDVFYTIAKQLGYRTRSAIKLKQIHEKLDILNGVEHAVDLCASPGGMTQFVRRMLPDDDKNRVLGIDIQPIAPVEGVEFWQRDITEETLVSEICQFFEGKVGLVVSDGSPDTLGTCYEEVCFQIDLSQSSAIIALAILKPGGNFVAKVFRSDACNQVATVLQSFFEKVVITKPRTCRHSSNEAYLVALRLKAENPMQSKDFNEFADFFRTLCSQPATKIVEFLPCGENYEYDADSNYDDSFVDADITQKMEPIQLPIAPAYKISLEHRQQSYGVKYDA